MNLDHLEVFRAIARRENISQAARDLYISKSAASKALKQLEDELGTDLFERNGKRIRLNRKGETLLHYADIASNSLNEAMALINEQRETRQKMIRAIFRIPLGDPIDAISGFMRQNPRITPHIATDSEVHGDCDLELLHSNEAITDPNTVKVCDDALCALLPKTHPLASGKDLAKPIAVEQIASEPFVLHKRTIADERFAGLCDRYRFLPRRLLEYEHVPGILGYVSKGFASIGWCTTWLNADYDAIIARRLEGLDETAGIYIRLKQSHTPEAASLARHIEEHLRASYERQAHCFADRVS